MLVLLVLPPRVGETVLGASWHATQPLLLPTGIQIVWIGVFTGVRAGLLGTRAIRKVMLTDVATTLVVLTATIVGAVIDGVRGAWWAVAIGQGLMAIVWWITFWKHTSHPGPAAAGAAASPLQPVTVPSAPPV